MVFPGSTKPCRERRKSRCYVPEKHRENWLRFFRINLSAQTLARVSMTAVSFRTLADPPLCSWINWHGVGDSHAKEEKKVQAKLQNLRRTCFFFRSSLMNYQVELGKHRYLISPITTLPFTLSNVVRECGGGRGTRV